MAASSPRKADSRPIALVGLKAQQGHIRGAVEQAMLDHGAYIMGPEVYELEKELAAYSGVKHAISCASGTDALMILRRDRAVRNTHIEHRR
jgi:dTDP-4-amino-4,6-dideoxygalactose transaminase